MAPTHVRDVGAHIGRIEEQLLAYEAALKVGDYVHLVAEQLPFNSFEPRARLM